MKLYSKVAIGLASLAIVAGLAIVPSITKAQTIGSPGYTNLGDLFILDQLFNPGTGLNYGYGGYGGMSNLGDLFVLNRLFNPYGFGLGY